MVDKQLHIKKTTYLLTCLLSLTQSDIPKTGFHNYNPAKLIRVYISIKGEKIDGQCLTHADPKQQNDDMSRLTPVQDV